jgi:hypothetical protein
VPLPSTLPGAIDAVLALIDDPVQWPDTDKASRTCKALRKTLIAAHDMLKADAPVPRSSGRARVLPPKPVRDPAR